MISLLMAVGGFILRYLPNIGSFISDIWKGREEDRRQERMLQLQMQLEEKRAELALKGTIVNAEITEALAGLQADIAALANDVKDRDSARSYHSRLVTQMAQTLQHGKSLGLKSGWLIAPFYLVVLVEAVASCVVPGIAIAVVGAYFKYRFFGDSPTAYGPADFEIFWAVLGYFVAARTQRFAESKRVRIATGDGAN